MRILLFLVASVLACSSPSEPTAGPQPAAGAAGEGGAGGAGAAGAGGAAGASAGGAGAGTRPLVARPLYYRGNGAPYEPIDDGARLEVRLPPQGGYVLWIAAEVEGVQASKVEIRGRVRSKTTGVILAEEYRSVAVAPVEGEAGVVRPTPVTMRNVTNLPLCPNYGDEEFLGVPVELEIILDDPSTTPPGHGTAKRTVTLACAEGATRCPCECSLGYVLGKCGPSAEIPPDF